MSPTVITIFALFAGTTRPLLNRSAVPILFRGGYVRRVIPRLTVYARYCNINFYQRRYQVDDFYTALPSGTYTVHDLTTLMR